ncbi:hypothetical protein ANACOL_04340 [Anaerotruncus colihominis DSM 17241]|uniref:Uncharacterized protein n=1 Tax=Anaerotruncus colihominis DSM 17241 TaxID=445972 RepID=B0PHP7_9FIRM|nr:hypothetical protein ANACOL_04340 [Anaerotruncus colihominis DSM 17241]
MAVCIFCLVGLHVFEIIDGMNEKRGLLIVWESSLFILQIH